MIVVVQGGVGVGGSSSLKGGNIHVKYIQYTWGAGESECVLGALDASV